METLQQFRDFVGEAFQASGLKHTTFGKLVCGDPNLITELPHREFRESTRVKIAERIRDLRRDAAKTKKRRAA